MLSAFFDLPVGEFPLLHETGFEPHLLSALSIVLLFGWIVAKLLGWSAITINSHFEQTLKSYKYISPTSSILEDLFLNAFWDRCALCVPRWVAPNLITFSGAVFICFACILHYLFSPLLDHSAPWWVYTLFVICIFLYNTFDGMDGKVARNTKSGSALGELFDHGVDALVTTPLTAFGLDVLRLGCSNPLLRFALVGAQMNFALSNFSLLHCGRQNFIKIDCQEAQYFVMLCIFVLNLFPNLAETELIQGYTLSRSVILYVDISMIFNAVRNITVIALFYLRGEKCLYQNSSRQTFTTFLHQTICVLLFAVLSFISSVKLSYWTWVIISSFLSARMTNQLLVARMTGIQFPMIPTSILVCSFTAAYAWNTSSVKNYILEWHIALFSVLTWATYSVPMLLRFAKCLNVSIFRMSNLSKKE